MSYISFIKESVRHLRTTGTITRSSQEACKALVSFTDFDTARDIVELGAGDGVVTHHILKAMHPDARLFCFEVNDQFCQHLREIDDPRLLVIQDSAEKLEYYLEQNGISKVDSIISAIPFVAFSKEMTMDILTLCNKVLKSGGAFSQIHYSLVLKKVYKKIFGDIKIKFVLRNIPPAFVLYKIKDK